MAVCKKCGEEVDEVVSVQVGRRTLKVCESCADELREASEIAAGAESAMQGMMEYKGRR
ncbi:MAG: hypothetical protein HY903_16625 [Deltaproteobacteria bacterium]|nr:hypothetical protein [Deltaproteobacteria bacterium]